MKGCLTALIALPVVGWWLGVTLPACLIDSGTEHREGLDKRMAEGALGDVESRWGRTLDSMTFMVEKRVTSVRKCPGTPSGEEFEEMVSMLGGYSAEVRLYTLFGIPYGTALIHCDQRTYPERGQPVFTPPMMSAPAPFRRPEDRGCEHGSGAFLVADFGVWYSFSS